jgi:voltage-gated potassium channel
VPVSAFLAVVVAGVVGFVELAGVGPVEATFWLVDPTGIELHFAAHGGPERVTKVFAIAVTVGLVVAGVWTGETVLDATFEGRIQEELQRVRDERLAADRDDHVVVCGYGIFGRTVAAEAAAAGRDVVVIETDDQTAERAAEDYLVVDGDARRESVLADAGVDRASTLVAAIDDSNVNVQIALVAEELAPAVTTIVRVGDGTYEDLARRAGADRVVVPEVLSGQDVAGAFGTSPDETTPTDRD